HRQIGALRTPSCTLTWRMAVFANEAVYSAIRIAATVNRPSTIQALIGTRAACCRVFCQNNVAGARNGDCFSCFVEISYMGTSIFGHGKPKLQLPRCKAGR